MKKTFPELLKIELEGWCYGIANYPGEVTAALVHRVIEELQPTFLRAIEEGIEVDFIKFAQKLCKAAKFVVDEREVATSLLMNFPKPEYFNSKERECFERILRKVLNVFPEIEQILELKWQFDDEFFDEDV